MILEPGVILGRSFLRLAKGVVDFGNGVITIYLEPNPFEDDSEKTGKSLDDWDQLLDFNIDDVPKFREELPPFVCKMRKSNCNKKRAMENLNLFYQDIGPSSSAGRHLTQEETVKEDEEAVKRIKGEALKEKDDPGREDMKKIDRGITMINHTQAEAMGKLSNVLCQVGVTTMITKFLILDIPIDRDAPIVVAARFDVLRTAESDSDDEEEYVIKRNKFGAPIYGPLQEHTTEKPDHHDLNAQDNIKQWKNYYFHKFTMNFCYGKDVTEMQSLEIDDMLRIKFDEVCASDELQTKKIIKFRLGGRAHSLTLLEFARRLGLYQATELEEDEFNTPEWICEYGLVDCKVDEEEKSWYSKGKPNLLDLDTTTLKELIDSEGRLIPEDPQPCVPIVGILRPPRASMQD
ncbi:hypothetical protein Tco_1394605 [Tanacetum coccineum]